MLYQLHEAQRAVLNPISSWAEAMSQLYANPYSALAYAPFATRASAGFELLYRMGKEYEKPEFGLTETEIDGHSVKLQESIEIDKPFCRLIKFNRILPDKLKASENDPTLLLFAPLSGHHSTLLRDTVRALVPHHNVYVTDWVDARMVPVADGEFHLDTYIAYAIEFIRELGPDVHLMSVCQPTVPVMAAVSIMAAMKDPAMPLSMTMMGGPLDTRKSPTEVNALANDKPFEWFERNLIYVVPAKYPGAGRKVYPGFLQHAGFVSMNQDRHVDSHYDFYLNLVRGDLDDVEAHRKFYDEYNAVLDMPAEYYLDTISTVFQDHALPTGTWDVDFEGETYRVDPSKITNTALFTIEGELDDISGPGQTRSAHKLCSNIPEEHKKHTEAEGAGHYGIFSGRRWREIICPEVRQFILDHETRIGKSAAPAKRRATKKPA